MFFKSIAQSFLLPASILTLGFFVLYAASKLENKLENRGVKLYGLFTISFLWVCAISMLLGEMFEIGRADAQPQRNIPNSLLPAPRSETMPPPQTAPGVPNGDEEMTLNPDENTTGGKTNSGQEALHKCPYLRFHGNARAPYSPGNKHATIEI